MHAGHAENHLERAEANHIAVLDQLRLKRSQHQLTQARPVAALEILNIEEGLLKADARVLARNRRLGIERGQIDLRRNPTFRIEATDNDICILDRQALENLSILLVI